MDWLSAAIAAAAALGGVLLQARLESNRRSQFERDAAASEKRKRIREHELGRIDQTRRSLIDQLDFAWSIAQGDRGRALRLKDSVDQHLLSDPRLLGDIDLIRAWAVLVLRLLEKFPRGRLEKAVWPVIKRGTNFEDLDVVSTVRARMLAALEAQQRRALSDELLLTVTPDEVAAVVEVERINDRLRALLG